MTFRTQIHKKKFGKKCFRTPQDTMSHRPLTNTSSLKIAAAYCAVLALCKVVSCFKFLDTLHSLDTVILILASYILTGIVLRYSFAWQENFTKSPPNPGNHTGISCLLHLKFWSWSKAQTKDQDQNLKNLTPCAFLEEKPNVAHAFWSKQVQAIDKRM